MCIRDSNLIGSFDCGGTVEIGNQCYSLSEQSLTVKVFDDSHIHWSYDIQSESLSTNGYSENCELPDTNWVGLPVLDDDEKPLGVLRVKNKFRISNGEKSIAPLRDSDFSLLRSVVHALGFRISMDLSRVALIEKVKAQKKDLADFQDHQRILLHEFRAPAHAFLNLSLIHISEPTRPY